jgi:uncharacterized protein
MKAEALTTRELAMMEKVFLRHPEVHNVTLFGSRAKGTHAPNSDIDLSIRGQIDELQGEALAAELDELPLPYRFDVLVFDSLKSKPLREHIERVGVVIYPTRQA